MKQSSSVILVCGGAGFIGSNFIRQLLIRQPKAIVVCFDALTYAGSRNNLPLENPRLLFVKGDITDEQAVERAFKKYKPAHVINFAAESHVDRSIHGGAAAFAHTNVYGTTVLLQALLRAPQVEKFVQVSTDEVYGSLSLKSKKKFTEEAPLAPNSPYAASKAAADQMARAFHKTYGLPIVVTRCSNNYGPYQYPEKLIPFSITRLMEGKPIAIYGDGQYVRDWIHVDDHSSALILALMQGVPGEIYNIGADDEISNLELAYRLLTHFNKDVSAIRFVADRPGHDRRYAIDASKARRALEWKPVHSLDTSFETTVAWYVSNTSWIKKALKRADAANAHI